MTEDFLIRVDGSQRPDGDEEEDRISLSTRGSFVRRGRSYYISYKESEATGYMGSTTTVKVDGERKVTMLRFGAQRAEMIIEPGRHHRCHYETGAGGLLLGVSDGRIENNLSPDGGLLRFSYCLDVNAEIVSHNRVEITVDPI